MVAFVPLSPRARPDLRERRRRRRSAAALIITIHHSGPRPVVNDERVGGGGRFGVRIQQSTSGGMTIQTIYRPGQERKMRRKRKRRKRRRRRRRTSYHTGILSRLVHSNATINPCGHDKNKQSTRLDKEEGGGEGGGEGEV